MFLGFMQARKNSVHISEVENAIDNEILRVVNDGITESELEQSKTRLRRSAIFARDSVTAPARIIGSLLLAGQTLEQIEAWPEKINEVTAKEVKEAAQYVFDSRKSVTAILNPKKKTQ